VFAGKKSAQIREILISESAWEEMTCLFAPSLNQIVTNLGLFKIENHDVNSIALEKITDVKNLVAPEKMPYAQSD